MKICEQCQSASWPYLVAVFIAGVTSFLTWLTLGYSGFGFDATERILVAVGMLLAVGASLISYMTACMQRHCHHNHSHTHHHNQRRSSQPVNGQHVHRPVGV